MSDPKNETLSGFTKNLASICKEMSQDHKLKGVSEKLLGWHTWSEFPLSTQKNATPSHWNVARGALYDMTAHALRRKFSGDGKEEEVKACLGWLRFVLERAAEDSWRGLPEVDRLWPLIANPECPFFAAHDAPPTLARALSLPDVSPSAGPGGGGGEEEGSIHRAPAPTPSDVVKMNGRLFATDLTKDDACDFYVTELGAWVPAQVQQFASDDDGKYMRVLLPTLTLLSKDKASQMAVDSEGPGSEGPAAISDSFWISLSVNDGLCRVAPLGRHTGKKAGAPAAAPAPAAAAPTTPKAQWVLNPSPAELAWRQSLRPGSLLDALGSSGWRQAMVVQDVTPPASVGGGGGGGGGGDGGGGGAASGGSPGAAAGAAPPPPPLKAPCTLHSWAPQPPWMQPSTAPAPTLRP
jgi:hypothetical protein